MVASKYRTTATAYSRGLDVTSGEENLAPMSGKAEPGSLTVADNARFSREGGVFTRLGFEQKADLGSSAKVDTIITMDEFDVMFAKSGTDIYQSIDGSTWYSIGATVTAGERSAMFADGNNVYVGSATDGYMRIAVSTLQTAIVAATSTTVTVRAGDGQFYTNGSATIYIEGDAISSTSRSSDDITVTDSTIDANHAVGTIVTEVFTVDANLGATAINELDNSIVVAEGNTVKYSAPYTEANPEYAYDFSANGAGAKKFITEVTALGEVVGGLLVGTKKTMEFAYAFDLDTGGLLTRAVSKTHGVPNAFCFAQGDKVSYVFTGRRVLPVVSDANGVQVVDDIFNDRNNLDYPVRSFLNGLDDDQSLSFSHYDPSTSELTVSVIENGISKELVYIEDIGTWSIDNGKPFGCKTNFKGRVYAGDEADDKIHLADEDVGDNTDAIGHRFVSSLYTVANKTVSSDYLKFTFSGLLSGAGEFILRIYANGILEQEETITASDLQSAGLMDTSAGIPLGSGTIGSSTIGSSGTIVEVFPFSYPYEMLLTGRTIQFEWEVVDDGTMLEIRSSTLDAETSNSLYLDSQ